MIRSALKYRRRYGNVRETGAVVWAQHDASVTLPPLPGSPTEFDALMVGDMGPAPSASPPHPPPPLPPLRPPTHVRTRTYTHLHTQTRARARATPRARLPTWPETHTRALFKSMRMHQGTPYTGAHSLGLASNFRHVCRQSRACTFVQGILAHTAMIAVLI
jgi:hypothetical protein